MEGDEALRLKLWFGLIDLVCSDGGFDESRDADFFLELEDGRFGTARNVTGRVRHNGAAAPGWLGCHYYIWFVGVSALGESSSRAEGPVSR
jgi:hypothetical protein